MAFPKWSLLLCVVLAGSGTARGAVISSASSGDFIDVNIQVSTALASATAQLNNVALAADSGPPVYSVENEVLNFTTDVGALSTVVTSVATDVVTSNADSNVDGSFGPKYATGSHSIDSLDLSVGVLPAVPVVSFTATTIDVASTVSGDFNNLTAVGTLNVEDLVISISGAVFKTLNGVIAPNTGIDLSGVLGGATLILNQQITSGNGINSLALTTNAISLNLTNVGVTGLVTLGGNVTVGESFASLNASAVPEPSSAILLGLMGVGGAWGLRRSKRKARLTPEI